MPSMGGLEVLRTLHQKHQLPRVIVLTGALDDDAAFELISLGVNGILLKEEAPRMLIDSIHAVARGERRIEPRLMQQALDAALRAQARRTGKGESLTPSERKITKHVCEGSSNKRIANQVGISEATVKLHLHRVFRKLGVSNRVQLTLRARELGLD
jgi:two-component system, NarL family, nitrate/nitrite response regulator NarL